MMKLLQLLTLVLILMAPSVSATEIFVWKSRPIELKLEVGKERVIEFPMNVKLGMNPALRKRIRLGNAAGKIYITPVQSFPKTRIQARLEDGQILYLDLHAGRPHGTDLPEDVKIVFPDQVDEEVAAFGLVKEPKMGITEVQLTRYAIIDNYGVKRLLPNLPITKSEIKRPLNLEFLFGGSSAAMFDLVAEKQYRTQRFTLTYIRLVNRTNQTQEIRVTDIPAFHSGVVSQHLTVGPKGSLSQISHLYLLTPKPLAEYKQFSATLAKPDANDAEVNDAS